MNPIETTVINNGQKRAARDKPKNASTAKTAPITNSRNASRLGTSDSLRTRVPIGSSANCLVYGQPDPREGADPRETGGAPADIHNPPNGAPNLSETNALILAEPNSTRPLYPNASTARHPGQHTVGKNGPPAYSLKHGHWAQTRLTAAAQNNRSGTGESGT